MSEPNPEIFQRPHRMPVINALKEAVTNVLKNLSAETGKFLELGCGDGFFYRELMPEYLQPGYHGIDLHDPSLERFKELVPGVNVRRGKVEKIPYPPGSMDVVLGFSAYSFLNKPGVAFSRIHEVLRPGGRLVLIQDSGLYDRSTPAKKTDVYDEMKMVENAHKDIRKNLKDAGLAFIAGDDVMEAAVVTPYNGMLKRIPKSDLERVPEGHIVIGFTSDMGINILRHANPSEVARKLEQVKSELGSPRILEDKTIRGRSKVVEYARVRYLVAERP